jgi:anti-anti-sigma factor
VRLAIAGELDIANSEAFTDELQSVCEGASREVTIDFQNCSFIDSTAIRALIFLAREQQARGGKLKLSGLRGEPQRVLGVSGLLHSGLFANDG